MGSLAVRILGTVGAAALSVTMFGSGVASAKDPLIGFTYDDAVAAISKWNGKAVVSTVSGSALDMGDCIVTSWHTSIFLDDRGQNKRKNEYLLSLNCNNPVASPGHPGNSVMTPEGARGKRDAKAAASINKNPAWCHSSDERLQQCQVICERSGLCEI